jgi:hypothetical protein
MLVAMSRSSRLVRCEDSDSIWKAGRAWTHGLNTYAHLWPTAEDRTRAAANDLMATAAADFLRTKVNRQGHDQGR